MQAAQSKYANENLYYLTTHHTDVKLPAPPEFILNSLNSLNFNDISKYISF